MELHINGAGQTVTGSEYLLIINQHRILVDCGLYQGNNDKLTSMNRSFDFDAKSLDTVLLTHAHIDHSGNLPHLIKNGYKGPIYATAPTADLCDVMLQDSAKIQQYDAEYATKKALRRGEPPVEPLYTIADAAAVYQYFRKMNYNQSVEVLPGIFATFVDAGHILGAAAVILDVHEGDRSYRMWFSGDIGRAGLPLISDPVFPVDVDYMLMETTYGDTLHATPEQAYEELKAATIKAINKGGKIIIPAFSVGRTQDLIYNFNRMMQNGEVPKLPIYVDSPLSVSTTKVFQKYANSFDNETKLFVQRYHNPALYPPNVTYIDNLDQSKSLNNIHTQMIIISASGMATAGRILHHLKNNIQNPRNSVFLVSWQSPDSLGRRLQDGDKQVRIFGDLYDVRSEVTMIHGFSAHADQKTLLDYALSTKDTLKKLILIHGEQDAVTPFEALLTENGITDFVYPRWGDVIEI